MNRRAVAALAMVPLLAVACSGDAAPEQELLSVVEVETSAAQIGTLLDSMVTTYEAGDEDQAGELAAQAYLDHYEDLEHTIDEADHDLNEELESLLGTQMRSLISDGGDAAELSVLVANAKTLLGQAVIAVQGT